MADLTEIPEGFPVKYCDPGTARGVEPQYMHSTGRKGARVTLLREPDVYENHLKEIAHTKISNMLIALAYNGKDNKLRNDRTKLIAWLETPSFKFWAKHSGMKLDEIMQKARIAIEKGNKPFVLSQPQIKRKNHRQLAREKAEALFT